jgi:hypothetical protein
MIARHAPASDDPKRYDVRIVDYLNPSPRYWLNVTQPWFEDNLLVIEMYDSSTQIIPMSSNVALVTITERISRV